VPPDVAAGGAGRGDGDAGFDGHLVGVGFDGNRDGLACVRQADLDPLAADHDRPAHRDPPGDRERIRQPGRLCCSGSSSPQPRAGLLGNRAGDGTGQDAAGQDVGDRAVQPHCHPLPGQRQPGADDVVADADIARGIHGLLDLDHVTGRGRQRRRPGGSGPGGGEAGQVAGTQPGRQGLDPEPVQEHVDPVQPGV
jgi:hypothetical protein